VKNRLLIIILPGLSMLGAFSTDTYLPSFPSIATEFQIGLDIVQQTLTIYLLAIAVRILFHGTLSDAVGRRPVILGGLAIYLAASIGALLCRQFFIPASLPPASGHIRRRGHGGRPGNDSRPLFPDPRLKRSCPIRRLFSGSPP
jgi:MFS family permease